MRLKALVYAASLLAGSAVVYAAEPAASQFTVSEQSKVPGLTLKPGTYSIRVVDHLSDRLIVRVDSAQGNSHATFLGIQNSNIAKPNASGPVVWTKSPKGGTILRGFEFPGGGSVVEFVYPKADAVSIAKVNDSKVPAIDPASEGKVADKDLSKDDLEVVTLWLLSSTTVGPKDGPAIQAEKYQAPAATTTQVASVEPTPTPSVSSGTGVSGGSGAPQPTYNAPATTSQPQQVARLHKPKPVIAKLPHTASLLPLVWMLGAMSLLGAAILRLIRSGVAGTR